MATLCKHQIIEHLERGELLINPSRKENGEFDVEPASYDLRAGTIVWKDTTIVKGESHIETRHYNPELPLAKQEIVTLQPGQVMFVITYEEVKMPVNLCGTVYAKNKFSRDGILALTTGHIDPGIQCPIVIRLINLRSIPYTFLLGEPIYTIVFHKLEPTDAQLLESHRPITMETTYSRTIESANAALGNAFNDLSMTNDFIRKEDFGKAFWRLIKKNAIKTFLLVIAFLVTLSTIISGLPTFFDYLKKLTQ